MKFPAASSHWQDSRVTLTEFTWVRTNTSTPHDAMSLELLTIGCSTICRVRRLMKQLTSRPTLPSPPRPQEPCSRSALMEIIKDPSLRQGRGWDISATEGDRQSGWDGDCVMPRRAMEKEQRHSSLSLAPIPLPHMLPSRAGCRVSPAPPTARPIRLTHH